MASLKLKLRMPSAISKEGSLYYQVIHGGVTRQINTGCRIFPCEWDAKRSVISCNAFSPKSRSAELQRINDVLSGEHRCLCKIMDMLDAGGQAYTADDIAKRYKETSCAGTTVFEFIRRQAERLRRIGRTRTADTYTEALSSIMKFRRNADFYFSQFDCFMMEQYEAWMKARHLCRNTTSFYMRVLRAIYNRAAAEGLSCNINPFKNVYTGIDKTSRRAITLQDIVRIKRLDLSDNKPLEFARDIFILSFCLRGMSFIDMAYLRKTDLSNGFITYNRRKTGQQLVIRWESQMQYFLDKYKPTDTRYLLPIIMREDGTEERQYRNCMLVVNRRLKTVAGKAGLQMPLTLYVARHSWASIAKAKNVPISIISGAMGHDSESTTQIYLASIQTNTIDDANHNILKEL